MTAMGPGPSIPLVLHGVTLSLQSELESFTDYVRTAMAPLLCAGDVTPRIEARLRWIEGRPPASLEESFGVGRWDRRPDRDVYLAGDSVYWLRVDDFTDLHVAAAWRDGHLFVEGRYHFQVGRTRWLEPMRRLRHRGRMDVLRARRFSTLLYYLVYHPLLWYLSRFEGWHLLHGGAVAAEGAGPVFVGMPGCGKSTLAVAMLAEPRWRMLSDNLVLFSSSRVRACPEVLLLDDRSRRRVGAGASRLVATGERRVYQRDAYRPDAVELDAMVPLGVFDVERAASTSMEEIDPVGCAARIEADNTMAKEVRRARVMAQVLDLVAGTRPPDDRADLASLLARTRCHVLAVGENAELSEVIHRYVLPALETDGERGQVRA